MSWWGKGLGLAAGYAAGGLLGAALGAALGYSADKGVGGRHWRFGRTGHRLPGRLLEHLFSLLGAVAKADGRVSQREVVWTENLIQRMRPTRARRARVIRAFNSGRRPGFQIASCLAAMRTLVIRDPALGEILLQTLIDLARADGSIHNAQSSLIWRCGVSFGVSQAWLQQQLATGPGFAQSRPASDPYKILGVSVHANDKEVKLAYRRLMQRHHPDRLAPEEGGEARKEAARRSAEVRWAWEQLRLARGMR